MKTVKLVYFAGVRETIGCSEETVELPDGIDDIGALRRLVGARGAPWSLLDDDRGWRFALNRDMADRGDLPINDGDEIAVFPPVTGG